MEIRRISTALIYIHIHSTSNLRPASRQIMDDSTVPFGVPSYLPMNGGETDTKVRMCLHPTSVCTYKWY